MKIPKFLLCLLLIGCSPKSGNAKTEGVTNKVSGDHTSLKQLNDLILRRLSEDDFKEYSCEKFYSKQMSSDGTRCYFSKLSREEVLRILDELISPHVIGTIWADDYGQFHGVFTPKSDPTVEFGLATSMVKPKSEIYKSEPDIPKTYDSDVLYTPPLPKVNQ